MRITLPLLRVAVFGSLLSLLPVSSAAEVTELSHAQMRQLVAERQVLGTEQLVGSASNAYDGQVIDVRGFLSEGRMTYRMLLQRGDGSVIEVLMNGQSGQFVSHRSQMAQVVSEAARGRSTSSASSGQHSRTQTLSSNDQSSRANGSNRRSGGSSENADSGSSSENNANENRSETANNASRSNNRDNASNNRGNKENRGNGNGRDD